MKYIFSILVCFWLLGAEAQTNIYHHFPSANAVWNQTFRSYWCPIYPYYHEEVYSLVLSGDTTIGANIYHKILTPYVQFNDTCWGPSTNTYPIYQGAIREDSALRKVFYVLKNDSIEWVLYDFSLQPGDTVTSFLLQGCDFVPTTVTQVDSVMINGSYRKRWIWTEQGMAFNTEVIEGIGSLYGLLAASCLLIDGPELFLSCFSENNVIMYVNPSNPTWSCDIIDGMNRTMPFNPAIALFPNPFHDEAILHTTIKNQQVQIKIYNVIGMLVRDEKVNFNQNGDAKILRGLLDEGMYFIELTGDDGMQADVEKLIVE